MLYPVSLLLNDGSVSLECRLIYRKKALLYCQLAYINKPSLILEIFRIVTFIKVA